VSKDSIHLSRELVVTWPEMRRIDPFFFLAAVVLRKKSVYGRKDEVEVVDAESVWMRVRKNLPELPKATLAPA